MEICVKDSLKIAEIWLTNAEQCDVALRDSLQSLFDEYKQKKYKVAVFESGHGDLVYNTAGLLLHNRA